MATKQTHLNNEKARNYPFLEEMYADSYYPKKCVDKGKEILVDLCFQIEASTPENLDELYQLTNAATDKFNDLQDCFDENDSEIETVAREYIGANFGFIARTYGFEAADIEALIATRDW